MSQHEQVKRVNKAIDSSLKAYDTYGKHGSAQMRLSQRIKASFLRKITKGIQKHDKISKEANTSRFCALPWFRKLAYTNGYLCGDMKKKYAAEGRIVEFKPGPATPKLKHVGGGGRVAEYVPRSSKHLDTERMANSEMSMARHDVAVEDNNRDSTQGSRGGGARSRARARARKKADAKKRAREKELKRALSRVRL